MMHVQLMRGEHNLLALMMRPGTQCDVASVWIERSTILQIHSLSAKDSLDYSDDSSYGFIMILEIEA